MREYTIAAIPADGIGPEVIGAGLEALDALQQRCGDFRLDVTHFDWGSDYYKRHGVMMPEDGLETLKPFHAIYFGAVGAPDVPDHITLWGLRLRICQTFDQYANVRPTRILPGVATPLANCKPGDLDWVIVRENSEGEYAGHGGRAHRGLPEEVGTEVSIFTRTGVTRIIRYAFSIARSRPRKLLTVVTKSNAQRFGMVMWDEIAAEVAREFPDVAWDKMLVDAMTTRMVLKPFHHRHRRRHQPPRRHPVGSGRGARRQPRHRADGEYRSRTPLSFDVRAHSRLRVRHYREGHRQSRCQLLDSRADAGAPWRGGCRQASDARRRANHLQRSRHTRSRRRCDDGRGDEGGLRGDPSQLILFTESDCVGDAVSLSQSGGGAQPYGSASSHGRLQMAQFIVNFIRGRHRLGDFVAYGIAESPSETVYCNLDGTFGHAQHRRGFGVGRRWLISGEDRA
jgi:hypothetical protein